MSFVNYVPTGNAEIHLNLKNILDHFDLTVQDSLANLRPGGCTEGQFHGIKEPLLD